MQRKKNMVKKSKIITLILLPTTLIIFLTGWCLQFVGSSKKAEQRKKESYDMHIED
jgi:flagellar basal body-associated protein FliL